MTKKSYMIFLQKSLDCIYDTPKASIYACIGLRWLYVEQIRWIRSHPQHVSKIVILYLDIMLNFADINNFLFLLFFIKTGLTSTTFTKEAARGMTRPWTGAVGPLTRPWKCFYRGRPFTRPWKAWFLAARDSYGCRARPYKCCFIRPWKPFLQ